MRINASSTRRVGALASGEEGWGWVVVAHTRIAETCQNLPMTGLCVMRFTLLTGPGYVRIIVYRRGANPKVVP